MKTKKNQDRQDRQDRLGRFMDDLLFRLSRKTQTICVPHCPRCGSLVGSVDEDNNSHIESWCIECGYQLKPLE